MRLSFKEIESEIKRCFVKYGMSEEKAQICAKIHTETTNDGVYSHGVNRVARFCDYIQKGWVDPNAEPVLEKDLGAIQIYNGNMGPGILNALYAADRGMELADKYGIGFIGLKNTTHWMRGGSYGLYCAQKGYSCIMWTNTEAVMPPWGGSECRLGNNPFVMALPGKDGLPELKLDMAMTQYSFGKLQVTRLAGKKLPYPGGFDNEGNLTDDPGAIEESMRALPIGYWKGSGFALMLDLFAAVLTDGIGVTRLGERGSCGGCSQVMIIFDHKRIISDEHYDALIRETVDYVKSSALAEGARDIQVPGESFKRFHEDHEKNGIFVDDEVWKQIKAL